VRHTFTHTSPTFEKNKRKEKNNILGMAYLNPINHMSIKTHCITINLIITENKVDLSSIQAK
jgi:hypothetical protein